MTVLVHVFELFARISLQLCAYGCLMQNLRDFRMYDLGRRAKIHVSIETFPRASNTCHKWTERGSRYDMKRN